MGKKSRRPNRRNRKRPDMPTPDELTIAVATSPQGADSALSLEKELSLVKAAVLYADRVQLMSPVTAMNLGVHGMANASQADLLEFLASLDDHTIQRLGGNLAPGWRQSFLPQVKTLLGLSPMQNSVAQAAVGPAMEQLSRIQEKMNLELAKMREELTTQFERVGGTELLGGLESGLIQLADSGLNAQSTDAMVTAYIDLLKNLLRDHRTHLMFDDSTGDLVRSLIRENHVNPHQLALRHSSNASLGSGLIRRLPAFTAAPLGEIIDLRADMDGALSRYRRAVAGFSERISSPSYEAEFESEVDDLWRNEVDPAIHEIKESLADHSLVREIGRHLGADLKNMVFAASGPFVALGVQSFAGLDAMVSTALGAATPVLAVSQEAVKSVQARHEAVRSAKSNDLFYLYDLGAKL